MENSLRAHTLFGNLFYSPSSSLQLFGNGVYHKGSSLINDVPLDPSGLAQQPLGLDFPLLGREIGGFSSIEIERLSAALGFNLQLGDRLVWHAMGEYADYSDLDPYLFSTDGSRISFQTGVILLW